MVSRSFGNKLFEKFEKQEACDVFFSCPDDQHITADEKFKVIGAHKLILSLASEVFDAMFNGPITKKAKNEGLDEPYVISDIKFSCFYQLLSYTYGKKVYFVDLQAACDFYYAAGKYICHDALKFVSDYLASTLNPFSLYDFASFQNNETLKQAAIKKFITLDQTQIFQNDDILYAKPQTINDVFKLELKVKSEMILVHALDRYIKHNQHHDQEITSKVQPAIRSIRYLTLNFKEILDVPFLSAQDKIDLLHGLPPNPNLRKFPRMFSLCSKKRGTKQPKELKKYFK